MVFYPVGNELGWARDEFDADIDEFALKRLWKHREELDARFYDMDSHYGARDTYGLGYNHWFANSDEFENDYNNEDLDGGWWVKSLHVPSDIVKQIISEL